MPWLIGATFGRLPVTTTPTCWATSSAVRTYVAAVAPAIGTPLRVHW